MKTKTIINIATLVLFLPSLYTSFYPGKTFVISVVCIIVQLLLFSSLSKHFRFNEFENSRAIILYFTFEIITVSRAWINIEVWRDYAAAIIGPLSRILFIIWFLSVQKELAKYIIKSLLVVGTILNAYLYFNPASDPMMTFQHNMLWFCLLIFLYRYVKTKEYFIIIVASVFIATTSLDHRSVPLNFIVAFSILILYGVLIKIKRLIFVVSALLPISLFILFVTGTFNLFSYISSATEDTELSLKNDRNAFSDSRTAIYNDVMDATLNSGNLKNAIIGLGYKGKVNTLHNNVDSYGYKGVRISQEAQMLNQIQYGGIVGLITYSIFILASAYLAIFKSRNDLLKLIGFFLLFKYAYSYIEDLITFNAHTYFQYFVISCGYNKELRNMTDDDMYAYINKE